MLDDRGWLSLPSEPRCPCGSMSWLPTSGEHKGCPRFAEYPRSRSQRGGMAMHNFGQGTHTACLYCRQTWVPEGVTA